ncbi:flagellar biogenesis regulator UmoD [Proteus faecis]|uniref:Flagellar biogenesis regulator UmoD n=1 Tax=Proteus faecis TaxID=2050967 RepID=A0AAW7CPP6_9GAMM|nr:flagellar biogenesis regulator UmoD [Proteus faecis]MBG3012164.1 flagellar protein regulator [Proteus mirabilis]QNH64489.1 flagellar protein regulator [Proteus vulgaris]MCT8247997.1 flagellar protein regulator [Proteus faecis]MDL5165964.1 flagellar biogenesis regulator UmoD [Proteus faecis]MDL5273772.1 flagellar biogenesis regulator UmoD [Proteus faecis]
MGVNVRKYTLIGLIIALAILSFIVWRWVFPQPQYAHVVSATPIKSTVFVTEEYCHRIGLPTPFTPENLSRFHPAEQECRVFYMIEALNNSNIANFPYPQFKECIPIYRQERRIVGYDVLYTIDGTPGKVRTTFKPGEVIALDSDGRLILEQDPYCSMNEKVPCRKE